MLITFSGLDGSGKSTLAAWLQEELEQRERPVTVLHFNDDVGVYASLRAVRDGLLGPPRTAGAPRLHRRTTGAGRIRDALLWSKTLRRLLYPVDLLIFLGYRLYIEKLQRRILIMDRCLYDRLVDVVDGETRRWLCAMVRLTPMPDLAVLLVITPEEAFARKGEYTVPYLRRRGSAYRRVFHLVPGSIWLHAHELETAKRALARAMRERLRLSI